MAGLALAPLLHRQGFKVTLIEGRDGLVPPADDTRSINFTLTARGLRTLDALGMRERFLEAAQPLDGRCVHVDGEARVIPYADDRSAQLWSVRRTELASILASHVDATPGIDVRLGWQLTALSPCGTRVTAKRNAANGPSETFEADLIVGADGTFSRVRSEMMRYAPNQVRHTVSNWSYVKFDLSAATARRLGLAPDKIHIWRAESSLMVGIANRDGIVSFILLGWMAGSCDNTKGELGDSLVERLDRDYPPSLLAAIDAEVRREDLTAHMLNSLTVDRWSYGKRVALVGDAVHSMFPFYGQGLNTALEDALVLADALREGPSIARAIAAYVKKRKPPADAMVELSLQHLDTLLDACAQRPAVPARVGIDRFLARTFPGMWIEEYQEVCRGDLPIDAILRRSRLQQRVHRIVGADKFVANLETALKRVGELLPTPNASPRPLAVRYQPTDRRRR